MCMSIINIKFEQWALMVNNTTNIKNHLSPSMYCLTCERILKHHLHSQWCWIHSQHLLSYTVITRLCGGNAETRPWVCVKKNLLVSGHKNTSMGSGLWSEGDDTNHLASQSLHVGYINFRIFYKHYFVFGAMARLRVNYFQM